MRGTTYWIVRSLPLVDAVTLAFLLVAMVTWEHATGRPPALLILLLFVPLAKFFLTSAGVYDSHRLETVPEVVRRVGSAHLMLAASVLSLGYLLALRVVAAELAGVILLSFLILAAEKATVHAVLRELRSAGLDQRSVLFVGSAEQAARFARQVESHPEWGLRVDSTAYGRPEERTYFAFGSEEALGSSIEQVMKQRVIDEVLISADAVSLPGAFEEARRFEQYGLQVRVVIEPGPVQPRIESFVGVASLAVAPPPRSERDLAVKRLLDIGFASVGLLALAPLMLLIAILIKLTSPGPVLYSQVRAGLNGRRFRMYKFRTMVNGAEFLVRQAHRSITQGPIFKDPQDYRITAVGRVLRKFSLDELPQMWNVLRGEMSIVGPRPLPIYEAERIDGEYRRRFSVPPGLTCIWQVSGRSDVTYDAWMRQDLQYVDRWSLWFDTKLIAKTIPVVLTGRGGY